MTAISGFVEVVSVSLVIPFVAMASGSLPFGNANRITRLLLDWMAAAGVPPKMTTAGLGGVFLLGVAAANVYLCLYQYYAAQVVQRQRNKFSTQIIRNLAGQPIEWVDRENSSDLIKVALTDVSYVCYIIQAVTQISAILTRSLLVYLFFLFTQARLALSLAAALLVLYRLVYVYIQRPIQRAGEAAQATNARMFRVANELIGGARAVRASATEHTFCQRFVQASEEAISPQALRMMPGYLTRAGLEMATVAVVICLLVYFNAKDGSLANGLPLLSSYAVAGIRLLPALQQGVAYAFDIQFYSPCLIDVARLLRDRPSDRTIEQHPEPTPLKLLTRIDLENVSYSYDGSRDTLAEITLSIQKNSRVAFVGETGAGKSTIVDLLLGLRSPSKGRMSVNGEPLDSLMSRAWKQDIGYVPQSIYLLDASIADNVAFGVRPEQVDMDRVRKACAAASIHEFIEGLPEGYGTYVGERGVRLSGGQCQRIGIARALYHDPDVVVFDEATSALDTQTESSVLDAITRLKGHKTLIVIAHRLNTVWDFDQICVLDQGRLVEQGTADSLLARGGIFARLAEHQLTGREA